jgi:hypothetical protein
MLIKVGAILEGYPVEDYVENSLDGGVGDPVRDSVENNLNNRYAIARLIALLAEKGVLSAPEIVYIVSGRPDCNAEFLKEARE